MGILLDTTMVFPMDTTMASTTQLLQLSRLPQLLKLPLLLRLLPLFTTQLLFSTTLLPLSTMQLLLSTMLPPLSIMLPLLLRLSPSQLPTLTLEHTLSSQPQSSRLSQSWLEDKLVRCHTEWLLLLKIELLNNL